MTRGSTMIDLTQFDQVRAAELDAGCWSANRAALQETQPDLAAVLEQTTLPAHWRPARTLDDVTSYRTDTPGTPAAWLGGSATPQTRAAAMLRDQSAEGRNIALPTIGAGYALRALLSRLEPYLAVYVFEAELPVLAAALRLHDFSATIRSGHCQLVPPGNEEAFLFALLDEHPGLLPPGRIFLSILVEAARLELLRRLCEKSAQYVTQQRGRRLAAVRTRLAEPAPPLTEPRLAIMAMEGDQLNTALGDQFATAATALDWPACCCGPTDPFMSHPLVHAEKLAELRPNVTLFTSPATVPLQFDPPGHVCRWYRYIGHVPTEPPPDGVCLAAAPRVQEALLQAGVPAERCAPFYWGVTPADAPPATPGEPWVLVVGDLPDVTPESFGIKQATHQRLWQYLARTIGENWESARVVRSEQALVNGERATGVALSDETLRHSFVRLIEHVLVPATVLERCVQHLCNAGLAVRGLGWGWSRLAPRVEPLATDIYALEGHGTTLAPRACLVAGDRTVLGPGLLQAANLGWPLLVHDLGGQTLAGTLGDVLRADQHFLSFSDLAGLRTALRMIREAAPPVARRLERAREHVRTHHTWQRRLQDLQAWLIDHV